MNKNITPQTLQRLPLYLSYLKSLPKKGGSVYVSATAIAEALSLNDVQVRKDLASVSSKGRPKVGYVIVELIEDINRFLGFNSKKGVIIAGAGNIGRSLLSYEGFSDYGLEVIAGFDTNKELIGTRLGGKPVYPVEDMKAFCQREHITTGIITVPEDAAQEMCDIMVSAGITAVLNFAPVHLTAPEGVTVRNENIAIALAMLSKHSMKLPE